MPKRPRQHVLEYESKNQFRQCIPATWVYRESVPDYGIDAEIEIFDENGKSTGLLFVCQLKATDNAAIERALKIRMKKELYDYYLSLSLPVMIVLYHSSTKKIYWHWIHEFDPYYGGKGKKTWGFSIPSENAWGDKTAKLIQEDLELLRYFRSGSLGFPLSFYLDIQEEYVPNSPWSDIQISLKKIQASVSEIVNISTKRPEKETFKISFREDKIIIGIRRKASFTLHIEKSYYRKTEPDNVAKDILVAIAIYLDSIGYTHEACELAAKYYVNSIVAKSDYWTIIVASLFMRARRFSDALDVAEQLQERRPLLAQTFAITACAKFSNLSKVEFARYERLLSNALRLAKKQRASKETAFCHYNLGHYYRSRGKKYLKRALRHYKLAKKYDESYGQREYFWRELGGIYFESDMFSMSARCYKMALDLGIEDKAKADLVKARRADALMFAGKYSEAKGLFGIYLSEADETYDEYCLKRSAMKILTEKIGIRDQKRDPEAATKIAEKEKSDYRSLYKAIEKDALSSLAWFNIGVGANLAGKREEAFFAFLMAALINRCDLEAYFNCIKLWFGLKYELHLFIHIVRFAYWVNGVSFFEGLKLNLAMSMPTRPSQDIDSFVTMAMDFVIEIVKEVKRGKGSVEMRVHFGDSYTTIPIE
jgi:tetratricopeptide (TPR) repeat protein